MERIPSRQYTPEFKREAVKLVLEQGVGVRKRHGGWICR
jgi:transposase-like protein